MIKTACQRQDCLNFFVKRVHMAEADETFCIASIATPSANCMRYVPPSWKPWANRSQRKERR